MNLGLNLTPVINYLHQHPHTGFIAAFLISFVESLPIIGAIIPGSITMTAMGTMIGSSVLPAYSTFGWAIIGALAGDTISYFAGFRYHLTLRNVWPMKNYPKLFSYGENFFKKHGGKSLIIGRFIGPMRSAIPLVAGIMQMSKMRFFVSAIPSAILWAFAYMLPGVMIGAISQEMPHGKAASFILGFILVMVGFWLLIWLIKLSIVRIMRIFHHLMHRSWGWLQNRRATRGITTWLQQHDSPHEHKPLNYALMSLLSWIFFFIFLYSTIHQGRFSHWNTHVFYLLQSIHTPGLTLFWSWVGMLAEKPVIFSMCILLWLWFMKQGFRRSAWYWLSLVVTTILITGLFKALFYHPRPGGLTYFITSSSFPSGHTTLAMSFFGFLTYLFTHRIRSRMWHTIQYSIALTLILMIAFARLYLGAHWLLDVAGGLSLGCAILFLIVILYRRFPCEDIPPRKLTLVVALCLLIPWLIYGTLRIKQYNAGFQPIWPKVHLSTQSWWQKPTHHLPLYRLSRLGLPAQPFNIQWSGEIKQIDNKLTSKGWKRYHQEEKLKSMIERLITLKPSKHMPLFPPLFHNKPPAAIFIRTLSEKNVILELRLWNASATLNNGQKIWLGNISYHSAGEKIIAIHAKDRSHYEILNALDYLKPMTKKINQKIIQIPLEQQPKTIRYQAWDGQIILLKSAS